MHAQPSRSGEVERELGADAGNAALVRAAILVLRESGRTSELTPHDLAHEAWLRLRRSARVDGGVVLTLGAERVMRRILIDENRAQRRTARSTSAEDSIERAPERRSSGRELGDVLDALRTLAERDSIAAHATVLRHLLDRTTAETARSLGVSPSTVERALRRAKSFLRERLGPG